MINYYEIHLPCLECDGEGVIERRYVVSNTEGKEYGIEEEHCEPCDGTGEKVLGDFYESMEDLKADYPDTIRTVIIR